MRRILSVLVVPLLGGCQTWGPTWSEISGETYPSGKIEQYRRPAFVERIDGQTAFIGDPIRVDPGVHRIEVWAPDPRWPTGSGNKLIVVDAAPCKRYYVNAQFENNLSREWMPVIDYVGDIPLCETAAKK